jgi:hypothetical protein
MIALWVEAIVFHVKIAAPSFFVSVDFAARPVHLFELAVLETLVENFVPVILDGESFVFEKFEIFNVCRVRQVDKNADFFTITTTEASRQ